MCDCGTVQRSALCRSRRELSNANLLAKIGFDTAENEPSKVWPIATPRRRCTGHDRRSPRPASMRGRGSGLRTRRPPRTSSLPGLGEPKPAQLSPLAKNEQPSAAFREHFGKPGGSVRGERANFTRLVLGSIEAKIYN